jgi:hypothetical protein
MGKVKAEPARLDERSSLGGVIAQNVTQRPVQDMGACVTPPDRVTTWDIDSSPRLLTHCQEARVDTKPVTMQTLKSVSGVDDDAGARLGLDDTGVTDLAARFSVEGSPAQEQLDLLALLGPLDGLAVRDDGQNLPVGGFCLVPDEVGEPGDVEH